MRIAIASSGRFHVLDLARELSYLGHDVRFYSYVPKKRAIKFGLPPECHVGLLPFIFPLLILQYILGRRLNAISLNLIHLFLDYLVSKKLDSCDVFIGMSGMYLKSAKVAKDKYGSKIFIERGSRHILSQLDILEKLNAIDIPSGLSVRRELESYKIADKVVVPSKQVVESFLEYKFSKEKLFVNPYGVNIDLFKPNKKELNKKQTIIFVGLWCLRKGADLVTEAIKKIGDVKLIHVGPIGDFPFPKHESFEHFEPVDQFKLPNFYSASDVFILPSREEGLSLVVAQALSSGIPVVCSTRTGASDLMKFIDFPQAIFVVEPDDLGGFVKAIKQALDMSLTIGRRDLLGVKGRNFLSWKAYAKRYESELLCVIKK